MEQDSKNQQGYIAIISAIVIMAIIIVLAFAVSTSSYFLRFNVLDNESKKVSLGYADSCVQQAMVDIALGTQTAPKTVNIDATHSCKICSISGTSPVTINARAVYNNSYSNVSAQMTKDSYGNFTIQSWNDNLTNPDPSCLVP